MTGNDDRKLLEMAAKAAGVFMRREDWPFTDNFDPECLQTHYDNNEQSLTGTRLFYCDDGEIGGTEEYTWSLRQSRHRRVSPV